MDGDGRRELVVLPGLCGACGGRRCRGHVQGVFAGMERERRPGRGAKAAPRRVLEYQIGLGEGVESHAYIKAAAGVKAGQERPGKG